MTDEKMTDNEFIKALYILNKLDFFYGQRAGRELFNDKPIDIQDEDIRNFSNDVAFLKDFINHQNAEIERLEANNLSTQKTLSKMSLGVEQAKAEATKEFAERLCEGRVSNDPIVIAVKVELKEMLGEQDEN